MSLGRSAPEDELRRAEDALLAAMRRSDVAALDALLADDLDFVAPDGSRLDKHGDLEAHRSGATRFVELTPVSRTVDADGASGTTSLVARIVVLDHGHRVEATVRYERRWRLGGRGWQVASGSVTPVGEVT
jgi:ketosteroid isomerase-like protein